MRPATEVVSFRAPEELLRQIDESRARMKLSRGDWVRGIVHTHIHRSDQQVILDQFRSLFELHQELIAEVALLQRNLRWATFLNLTEPQLKAEDAKQRIRDNLKLTGDSQP